MRLTFNNLEELVARPGGESGGETSTRRCKGKCPQTWFALTEGRRFLCAIVGKSCPVLYSYSYSTARVQYEQSLMLALLFFCIFDIRVSHEHEYSTSYEYKYEYSTRAVRI